ncbi:MAG: 3-deoxy-manno-octulosonate cytidylyltransferase [Pseudomonadota bacterium]
MSFTVVIPARYASTRFPGKPLVDVNGKPMIQHVFERSIASGASAVYIATDDKRICARCNQFCDSVVMTSSEHENGTSRIAEVIETKNIPDDEIIINVQGDEPFIPPENIVQLADLLSNNDEASMSTLSFPIDDAADIFNPNVVKVVTDKHDRALYFSRSPIPFARDFIKGNELTVTIDELPFTYMRHIGIYGSRAGFVKTYKALPPTPLSVHESLEQLRVLEHGFAILIASANVAPPHGIDTPADLEKLLSSL